MPIAEGEWQSIRSLVQRMFSSRGEQIVTGIVNKVDSNRNLIYMKEFGQQPIPMVGQDFQITYYDTQYTLVGGVLKPQMIKKQAKVTQLVPPKGSQAVVLRELGTSRLPRCLGRLISRDWIQTGTD